MKRTTLPEHIVASISERIAEGSFREGDKLPSLREYARLYGYSKNTVITAYESLASEGWIEARHGKGFFVCAWSPAPKAEPAPQAYAQAMDTVWLMRQQFVREPGLSHLGEGFPPVDWLMDMRLDKFSRQVMRSGVTTLFRYGERLGNINLRQQLVKKLANISIMSSPRQIVTTFGANHAMDLVLQRFVKPGDSVLVENPGYYPLFGKLQLRGVRMLAVERQVDGPDTEALERILRKESPRLFFMQSAGHNPTGSDLSHRKAHAIIDIARKYNLILVENDALADFKLSSCAKLSAIDQLRNTLYLGSFSKSVSAALRVGFVAGDESLISELADVKMLLHTGNAEYAERTVNVILREGNFLRHLSRLQERLRQATAQGIEVLDKLGAEIFCRPEQSLYLWARFPGFGDANQLTITCLKKGIVLAPGSIFYVDRRQTVPWTRLNVAYLNDPKFYSVLKA